MQIWGAAWWCMSVSPALRRLRKEGHQESKAILGYILKSYLKRKKKRKSAWLHQRKL